MADKFFETQQCDRCGHSLAVGSSAIRTMSWFTDETICMECSDKEKEIKAALRKKGFESAMEGCGYIPNPETVEGQ